MTDEEYLEWLEERERKLRELEIRIKNLQDDINDQQNIMDPYYIKMRIFKLWYFSNFNKEYEE